VVQHEFQKFDKLLESFLGNNIFILKRKFYFSKVPNYGVFPELAVVIGVATQAGVVINGWPLQVLKYLLLLLYNFMWLQWNFRLLNKKGTFIGH
jgi:hypothetical protein